MNLIDTRFLPFLKGWSINEVYKNQNVVIPDINPFNYYEVLDKPGQIENEKQLSLWCGWTGSQQQGEYDAEVIINLRIEGQNVLNMNTKKVSAEIIKSGGAPMIVYFNNKFVTDFMSPFWLTKVPNGYQTVDDMNTYL